MGTAIVTTGTIVEIIDEWGLCDCVKALCFDTTALNSGVIGRVCIYLELEFSRELLHLACHNHISETMLVKIFSLHDVS
jgi:hypothetical protein